MALSPGTCLGPYEVTARIGAGGMGEVYRATDTNLGRQVAIKVLPDTFAHDPDRLARFEREAKTLASLNHLNIATIHGLEKTERLQALVMEFVDGPTLADRLARGAMSIDDALPIARQIVDALEAAHDHGIVHRDLKPANIKVRADGTVKVLDFGLAKVLEPGAAAVDASQSPTITSPAMTGLGVILGTAAYMSPEQAKGRAADTRSDIWAFGCVLYEMMTARPAFARETVSETIAAILENEPDWTALRSTPPALQTLLRWCLAKNPKKRLQAIGDARHLLAEEQLTPVMLPAPKPSPSARAAWVLTAASLIGLAAVSWLFIRSRPSDVRETRVDIVTGATSDPFSLALSPDGRRIAFVAANDGVQRLWLRSLEKTTGQALAGTEGASFPFWSPDSRAIAFWADGKLKRVDIEGGSLQTIAPDAAPRGGTWNADGTIVFAQRALGALFVVRASGGEVKPLTRLGDQQTSHRYPQFLPDGQQFIFYVQGPPATAGIYLGSLDGTAPKRLTASDAAAVYEPSGSLLFVRSGALVAQRLDFARKELTGDPISVADSIAFDPYRQASALSVSATGLIAFRSGAATRLQLTWFDRAGKIVGTVGAPDDNALVAPRLSPDGSRVAVFRTVQQNTDVFILDRERMVRFTVDASLDRFPMWSPDGTRIVFQSTRTPPNDLYQKLTNLTADEELLVGSDQDKRPNGYSPDGRYLAYSSVDPDTSFDIWMLGPEKQPSKFLKRPADDMWLSFSPDGRWVTYCSNAVSGRYEVYVRPFPGPGAEHQISTAGGIDPVWSRRGKELYYIAPDGTLMAAAVTATGATFESGQPEALFKTRIYGGADPNVGINYDVSADGRFLINRVLDDAVVDYAGTELDGAPMTGGFLFDAFSIILVNILLSGDNAVVIAMAVKSLNPRQRHLGIVLGAGVAAALRVVLTFFAGELLAFNYVQFVGGLLIMWIAVKLLTEAVEEGEGLVPAVSLWHATWLILVADITMSTDNVLAIAGIAKGNLALLVFGLGLSIAFVVFASGILARIMDAYRWVIYVGGAILGRVGGDMMLSDPWVRRWLKPSHALEIIVQVVCAASVLITGWALVKRAEAKSVSVLGP